jgi:hypothetical protein
MTDDRLAMRMAHDVLLYLTERRPELLPTSAWEALEALATALRGVQVVPARAGSDSVH